MYPVSALETLPSFALGLFGRLDKTVEVQTPLSHIGTSAWGVYRTFFSVLHRLRERPRVPEPQPLFLQGL